MDFQYQTKRQADALTLTLTGRLDTLSAANLAKEINDINTLPLQSVEVDISDLSYISSSGLRCFVNLFKGCKSKGAAFSITGMQPSVREIFDLTGFSAIFGIC